MYLNKVYGFYRYSPDDLLVVDCSPRHLVAPLWEGMKVINIGRAQLTVFCAWIQPPGLRRSLLFWRHVTWRLRCLNELSRHWLTRLRIRNLQLSTTCRLNRRDQLTTWLCQSLYSNVKPSPDLCVMHFSLQKTNRKRTYTNTAGKTGASSRKVIVYYCLQKAYETNREFARTKVGECLTSEIDNNPVEFVNTNIG